MPAQPPPAIGELLRGCNVTRVAMLLLDGVPEDGDLMRVDESEVFAVLVWHREC
jgi:hypothetical protein